MVVVDKEVRGGCKDTKRYLVCINDNFGDLVGRSVNMEGCPSGHKSWAPSTVLYPFLTSSYKREMALHVDRSCAPEFYPYVTYS
jgi:hypothetical protein